VAKKPRVQKVIDVDKAVIPSRGFKYPRPIRGRYLHHHVDKAVIPSRGFKYVGRLVHVDPVKVDKTVIPNKGFKLVQ
jgi:hypothetical protein